MRNMGRGLMGRAGHTGGFPHTVLLLAAWAVSAMLLAVAGCGGRAATGLDPAALAPGVEAALTAPAPAGVDAQLWRELTSALRTELSRRGKTASGMPLYEGTRVKDFNIVWKSAGTAQASWSFSMIGDYDQNGSVSMQDIVPVGLYFNMKQGGPLWSKARAADGNGDGVVNISDITPLGLHFGEAVVGFEMQYAAAPDAPAPWAWFRHVEYGTRTVRSSDGALVFTQTCEDLPGGSYYRVQPYYGPSGGVNTYGLPGNSCYLSAAGS